MQERFAVRDRYVGDIGDFAKYGLLRAVGRGKGLGIAWYLCADPEKTGTGDGRHVRYLQQPGEWRHLDCELFDMLKKLVDENRRSVAEVERSGVLGNAKFAGDPVDASKVPVRDRERWRREWFERVQSRLSACDLVFADPHNGLYPDERFKAARRVNAKRIPLAEATALSAKGRTAIIYHHNGRTAGGHDHEIRNWMRRLPGCSHAYYWRRRSNRTFFVLNPDAEVVDRLEEFGARWKCAGELYRL